MAQLGKGTAATVYKATWLGGEVALKTFDGPDNFDFNKEVSVLRGLSHPNIYPFCALLQMIACVQLL
jgi:serine/threonine protein kinase